MQTARERRVALVTGGSRGIGAGIARRLAADGIRVAVTYTSTPERAEAIVAEFGPDNIAAIRADSSDPDAVDAAVARTVELFGRLDVVVANAGIAAVGRLNELGSDQIDRMLQVNVHGVLHTLRAALRHLSDDGRIITIGSVNADRAPFPGAAVYSMTKAALQGLVRGLARDLGPRGITVNNIQPGPTANDRMPADSPAAARLTERMALPRLGTPDEIGAMVCYLAGPDARFVTGTTLTIDGGFTA
ncbi:putative oxidoreductase, SDR family [Nocardia nova SH22a]|uniref:Putative oxidoreductase, SDR family n=1 Tax=Nocardia nova SH22a TaxID=1415166 RepID=W5TB88_9NOCA|nr:SDR family oxidoreductase [Nocardia nova]AHH16635.1 putative oxidoreductase, SDR family [Nocardia nova SH22a]